MKKFLPVFISVLTVFGAYAQSPTGIPGDTNGNGNVTIADVVTIINHILGMPYHYLDEANADVNRDKAITVSDVGATVDVLMHHTEYNEEGQEITRIPDRLIASNFSNGSAEADIDVMLDDSKIYTCLQAEVVVPEGMTVSRVVTGPRASRHQLLCNFTDDGRVKIVLVSFNNLAFDEGEGALFTIKAVADGQCGNLKIDHIIAANADGNNYELGFSGGLSQGSSSGNIDPEGRQIAVNTVRDGVEVINAAGSVINVYTLNGELVKTVTAVSDYEKLRLQSGIYIVTVGPLRVKTVVP